MYSEKVQTLALIEDITCIEVRTPSGQLIDANEMILDHAYALDQSDHPQLPDYGITGVYQRISKDTRQLFHIQSDGPDALFITGIPKSGTCDTFSNQFKFQDPLFISYWEDSEIGYLFQIIKLKTRHENNSIRP